jgi:hypothetical protein
VATPKVLVVELAATDRDARFASRIPAAEGHVDNRRRLFDEAPQGSGRAVADYRALTAGQHGSPLPAIRGERKMAHCIYTAVQTVEAAIFDEPFDHRRAQAGSDQLCMIDDPVLPAS